MTREKPCSTCRQPFTATKASGRWPSSCSPVCKLAALDRLLEVLQKQRRELAARLEGERQRHG